MAWSPDSIAEKLRAAGLNEYCEQLLGYVRPTVRLHTTPAYTMEAIPLGASRIGGLPDLPADVPWPMREGRACEFIAQLNLREISRYDATGLLPKDGWLYFFFDGQDFNYQAGSETVLYFTGAAEWLTRVPEYYADLQRWPHYRPCRVSPEADFMLPNWQTFAVRELYDTIFSYKNGDEPTPDQVIAYENVTDSLIPPNEFSLHHLMGYPEPILQEDSLLHLPAAWDGEGYRADVIGAWRPLLQISSDEHTGMLWGDTSSLYYSIREDDLVARRFANAVCLGQSC